MSARELIGPNDSLSLANGWFNVWVIARQKRIRNAEEFWIRFGDVGKFKSSTGYKIITNLIHLHTTSFLISNFK